MNILITGGASGLGEAITRELAKNADNKVYFTYSKSQRNADKLTKEFSNVISVKCDFKNAEEINLLVDSIDKYGIDVLINNAYSGTAIKSYFHKTHSDEFLNDFVENIIPTIKITQSCINSFRKNKKGKIITILTSFLLNNPPIGSSTYVANKAYMSSLVKSWATENVKYNITSNSISPSFMQTGLTNDVDERIIEQMILEHPLKKLLTVEEVATTVSLLMNASDHVNGVDIVLNAGANVR